MNTQQLNFQPGDQQDQDWNQSARYALWGLALKALMREGQAAAQTYIDKLASGDAELQFELRLTADESEVHGHYCSHGARVRIVTLKMADTEPTAH